MLDLDIKTAEDLAAEAAESHKRRATAAIDRHVEAQSRALGYNSAAHLAGYATSTVSDWQAEAQAFVAWRDAVWQAAIGMLEGADPESPPSVEDVIAALPAWPG